MDQLQRRWPTSLISAETGPTVGYSIGMDGKPILSYQDDIFGEKQFSGNQIRTEHGELGDLVTVHLTEGVEGQYTSATVLIPGIDLGNANSQPLTYPDDREPTPRCDPSS